MSDSHAVSGEGDGRDGPSSPLTALASFADFLAGGPSLAASLATAARLVCEHLQGDGAFVYLTEESKLTCQADHGPAPRETLRRWERQLRMYGSNACERGQMLSLESLAPSGSAARRGNAGPALRAVLAAPLLVQGRNFGAVVVAKAHTYPWTPPEQAFLRTLCGLLSQAANGARAAQPALAGPDTGSAAVERRMQAGHDSNLQTTLSAIAAEATRALGTRFAAVFLTNASLDAFIAVVGSGKDSQVAAEMALVRHPHGGIIRQAILERRPVLFYQKTGNGGSDGAVAGEGRARERPLLAVPLIHYGQVLGATVYYYGPARRLAKEQVVQAEAFTAQSASAIAGVLEHQAIAEARSGLERRAGRGARYGIVICDSRLQLVFADETLWRLLGVDPLPQGTNLSSVLFEASRAVAEPESLKHLIDQILLDPESPVLEECRLRGDAARSLRVYSVLCRVTPEGPPYRVTLVEDASRDLETRKRQEEFLSLLAHELKGPISTIQGYSELMLRHLARGKVVTDPRWLEIIHVEIKRLTYLVGQFTELARSGSGDMVLRRSNVDPYELARHVMEEVQITTTTHQLILRAAEVVPQGHWDAGRISGVLRNLLDNAVKYSPEGGEIVVDLTADEEGVTFRVTDQGLGIPEECLDRVFEPYFRAHDEERYPSGMGLGLYLARQFVSAHGGRIWVESAVGRGSQFWFMLPFRRLPIPVERYA